MFDDELHADDAVPDILLEAIDESYALGQRLRVPEPDRVKALMATFDR